MRMSAALRLDAELVEAARAGDQRALRELVERQHPLVSCLAYSLTGDPGLGEELAQDVFLVAWRRLGQLRDARQFRYWLRGIARNLGHHCPRPQQREVSLESQALADNEITSTEPSPLERMIN